MDEDDIPIYEPRSNQGGCLGLLIPALLTLIFVIAWMAN